MPKTFQSIKQIKTSKRDKYGNLDVDFKEAIKSAYPHIEFSTHEPGYHGGDPDIWVQERGGNWILNYPDGEYKSNKHYHTAGSSIMAVETANDCRLNLAKRPLFLLRGRVYNDDYRSLSLTYFLFGQNEDDSYFCHKIRPCVGETGDLEACRRWIWNLKEGETVKARQGDLAFIPKRPSGKDLPENRISLGNHHVLGDRIKQTKHRTYVFNPRTFHEEHHSIVLEGWYELRLGRTWMRSSAD